MQHLDALSMQEARVLGSLQFLLPAPPGDAEGDSVAAVSDSLVPPQVPLCGRTRILRRGRMQNVS